METESTERCNQSIPRFTVAVRSFRLWKLKAIGKGSGIAHREGVAVRSFRLWKLKGAEFSAKVISSVVLQFVRSDCGN